MVYEDAHKKTNLNAELQKKISQPGFKFLNYGPHVKSFMSCQNLNNIV